MCVVYFIDWPIRALLGRWLGFLVGQSFSCAAANSNMYQMYLSICINRKRQREQERFLVLHFRRFRSAGRAAILAYKNSTLMLQGPFLHPGYASSQRLSSKPNIWQDAVPATHKATFQASRFEADSGPSTHQSGPTTRQWPGRLAPLLPSIVHHSIQLRLQCTRHLGHSPISTVPLLEPRGMLHLQSCELLCIW